MNQNELKQALTQGVVEVTFVKADGTIRVMMATTHADLLPKSTAVQPVSESSEPEVIKDANLFKVWDMEAAAWRSFRAERVTHWQPAP